VVDASACENFRNSRSIRSGAADSAVAHDHIHELLAGNHLDPDRAARGELDRVPDHVDEHLPELIRPRDARVPRERSHREVESLLGRLDAEGVPTSSITVVRSTSRISS
jgi:hypothetical protein